MIIFLQDIPLNAKKSEILVFIEPIFNDCFLGTPSFTLSLLDIEFLSIEDISVGRREKHALIRVFPNEVARRVIKHINGKPFKNSPVVAREYINRSTLNDRRKPREPVAAEFLDRRVGERRRVPLTNAWQRNPIQVERI